MTFIKQNIMSIVDKFRLATIRVQSSLANFELSDQTLFDKYGLQTEIMDLKNDDQVAAWCDIINNSYSEFNYTTESAREFFLTEPYMLNVVTYLFTGSCGGGIALQYQ